MAWRPETVDSVKEIIKADLARCDDTHRAAFREWVVEPYHAPILRYGQLETVVVVAKKLREVIYWEDVEKGFNVSAVDQDGRILNHYCNQDELGLALNRWIRVR